MSPMNLFMPCVKFPVLPVEFLVHSVDFLVSFTQCLEERGFAMIFLV